MYFFLGGGFGMSFWLVLGCKDVFFFVIGFREVCRASLFFAVEFFFLKFLRMRLDVDF